MYNVYTVLEKLKNEVYNLFQPIFTKLIPSDIVIIMLKLYKREWSERFSFPFVVFASPLSQKGASSCMFVYYFKRHDRS